MHDSSAPADAGAHATAPPADPPALPAAGGDWLRTVAQELGRVPLLLRHMRPSLELDAIDHLEPATLLALGVRALVWDVDGTLMHRGDSTVAPGPQHALTRLLAHPAFKHVILSNCGEARFLQLAEMFPGIPLLRVYRARYRHLYRRRLGGADHWTAGEPTPGELEGARALKKPSPELMRFALRELGTPPAHVAVIGDQRLTDVACASLAGARSVKVPTVGRESFPFPVRVLQRTEEALYRVFYRRRTAPRRAAPRASSGEVA